MSHNLGSFRCRIENNRNNGSHWLDCRHTALHYLQLAKVLNPSGASARLASSEVMGVNNTWTDLNALKRFLCAFPAGNSCKRPLSD